MTTAVRLAYLLVLGALVVAGSFITAPWWELAMIGAAVMVPVIVADIITSKRRPPATISKQR